MQVAIGGEAPSKNNADWLGLILCIFCGTLHCPENSLLRQGKNLFHIIKFQVTPNNWNSSNSSLYPFWEMLCLETFMPFFIFVLVHPKKKKSLIE